VDRRAVGLAAGLGVVGRRHLVEADLVIEQRVLQRREPREAETDTTPEFKVNSMSRTSIPVNAATKERLDRLKRDDETWDEFLTRITATEEPIEAGAWSDEAAEQAKESIRKSRENWR
jgi:hypothetical protein